MINVSADQSVKRELIPSGSHIARCYKMIHVGTVEDTYMGELKLSNKVRISFEVLDEMREFKKGEPKQPMVIDKEYSLSFNEKAILRHDLESWRGKGFSETELKGFDITKLAGVYAMINIIHKTSKKGVEYALISSISTPPKGMEKPEAVNDIFIFDYNENFNKEAVEQMPDFIKDKIKSSQEWKHNTSTINDEEPVVVSEDDDLPF